MVDVDNFFLYICGKDLFMKKILFILSLVLCSHFAQAQYNIDSLYNLKHKIEKAEIFDPVKYFEVFYSIYNSHIENGAYELGFLLINETMQVYNDKMGLVNTIYIRELMSCMASTEYIMGNYQLALHYAKKAEDMFDAVKDYENHYYLELQTKLCEYYRLAGDTISADKSVQKALSILKEKCNGDIWNVNTIKKMKLEIIFNNIGTDYMRKGDYEMAKKFYKVVFNAFEDNPSGEGFQTVGGNLVYLLSKQQHYEESIQIAKKCLLSCKDNYLRVYYYQMLTTDYIYLNDTTNTIKSLCDFNIRALFNIANHFSSFSELERDEYWYNIATSTYSFNNWVMYKIKLNPYINIFNFEMHSFLRDFSIKYPRLVSHFLKNYGNVHLQKQFIESQNQKNNYVFGQGSKDDYNDALAKEQNALIKMGYALEDSIVNRYTFYETLTQSITNYEFYIHFTDGEYYSINNDNSPNLSYYTAYLVGQKIGFPLYYYICPKYQVDSTLWMDESPELFYSELYSTENSKRLFNLYFKNLEQFFNGAHTIYYSTSGRLSYLNFDLFLDQNGVPLNEKYKMVRVSSIYEIPQVKARDLQNLSSAALYGNINYDTSFYDSSRGSKFGRLKNAGKEINSISNILKGQNITSTIFDRTSATEESFKNLSGKSPEILHLATHGFCFETDEKAADKPFAQNVNSYSQKESAMVLSGLALSGANNIWKGNFDLPNAEDGILTAYEISQLDLSNTRLAVLSACETARGRIFPVDGVFGLQRAFKQAGAGSILMSLWKVDDAATALFMEHFYKFLFETHDRHAALKMALSEVKKQHPDPYYWAAWVMLD